MTCTAKHTKYQVPNDQWRCPKCGAGAELGLFCIWDADETSEEYCELLHDGDFLQCDCGYQTHGAQFSKLARKKAGVATCPTCKGKGVIQGDQSCTRSET